MGDFVTVLMKTRKKKIKGYMIADSLFIRKPAETARKPSGIVVKKDNEQLFPLLGNTGECAIHRTRFANTQ